MRNSRFTKSMAAMEAVEEYADKALPKGLAEKIAIAAGCGQTMITEALKIYRTGSESDITSIKQGQRTVNSIYLKLRGVQREYRPAKPPADSRITELLTKSGGKLKTGGKMRDIMLAIKLVETITSEYRTDSEFRFCQDMAPIRRLARDMRDYLRRNVSRGICPDCKDGCDKCKGTGLVPNRFVGKPRPSVALSGGSK